MSDGFAPANSSERCEATAGPEGQDPLGSQRSCACIQNQLMGDGFAGADPSERCEAIEENMAARALTALI